MSDKLINIYTIGMEKDLGSPPLKPARSKAPAQLTTKGDGRARKHSAPAGLEKRKTTVSIQIVRMKTVIFPCYIKFKINKLCYLYSASKNFCGRA